MDDLGNYKEDTEDFLGTNPESDQPHLLWAVISSPWLVGLGDEILPSYIGIIIYKDPY